MAMVGAESEGAAQIDAAMERWSQGDVAGPGVAVWLASPDEPLTIQSEALTGGGDVARAHYDHVVVVSQTCDVRRPCWTPDGRGRPFVQVSPVVYLTGGELVEAAGGHRPRYVQVSALGDEAFADLDCCVTIEKATLARSATHQIGCPDDEAQMRFSRALRRQRGRFAFPDQVEDAVSGLRKRFRDKRNSQGPEGKAINEVVQLRANARPNWSAPEFELEVIMLVNPGALWPNGDGDDDEVATPDLMAWLGHERPVHEVAERLERAESPADRYALWQTLAEAWAGLCRPNDVVRSISGSVESAGEYSIFRSWREPSLDLEHLTDEAERLATGHVAAE